MIIIFAVSKITLVHYLSIISASELDIFYCSLGNKLVSNSVYYVCDLVVCKCVLTFSGEKNCSCTVERLIHSSLVIIVKNTQPLETTTGVM